MERIELTYEIQYDVDKATRDMIDRHHTSFKVLHEKFVKFLKGEGHKFVHSHSHVGPEGST